MSDCECLPGCPFYHDQMPIDSGIGAMYKQKYCVGDNTACARHMIVRTLGKPSVPPNLYPNQTDKAKQIIENG